MILNFIKTKFSDARSRTLIGFLFLTMLVVGLQNLRVGFETGHPGWVTPHHLAIIKHSSARHYFVGYTGKFQDKAGNINYAYFNRAPFYFEGLMHHILLPFENSLSMYTYMGHQMMNLVYILTVLQLFYFVNLFTSNRWRSVAITLLGASGYFLLLYKDLVEQNRVEQNRVGTLAVLIMAYAIVREEKEKNFKYLFSFTALASIFGEGAPASFLLLVWNLVSFYDYLKENRNIRTIFGYFKTRAFLAGTLSLFLVLFSLTYSVIAESNITGESILESDILSSATKRLGGQDDFQETFQDKLTVSNFASFQLIRFVMGQIPYNFHQYQPVAGFIVLLLLIHFGYMLYWRKEWRRPVFILFTGVILYSVVLKNLFRFHDFTITYYLLIGAFLNLALIDRIPDRYMKWATAAVALLYLAGLINLRNDLNRVAEQVNPVAMELEDITRNLGRDSIKKVYIPGGSRNLIKHSPYLPYYVFSPHIIVAEPSDAEYLISNTRRKRKQWTKVEQHHKHYYLYKRDDVKADSNTGSDREGSSGPSK